MSKVVELNQRDKEYTQEEVAILIAAKKCIDDELKRNTVEVSPGSSVDVGDNVVQLTIPHGISIQRSVGDKQTPGMKQVTATANLNGYAMIIALQSAFRTVCEKFNQADKADEMCWDLIERTVSAALELNISTEKAFAENNPELAEKIDVLKQTAKERLPKRLDKTSTTMKKGTDAKNKRLIVNFIGRMVPKSRKAA